MKCQRCNFEKVASVCGKTSDLCHVTINGEEQDGYVPPNIGIGGGDYLEFDYCLNCGQIQGKFPVGTPHTPKKGRRSHDY